MYKKVAILTIILAFVVSCGSNPAKESGLARVDVKSPVVVGTNIGKMLGVVTAIYDETGERLIWKNNRTSLSFKFSYDVPAGKYQIETTCGPSHYNDRKQKAPHFNFKLVRTKVNLQPGDYLELTTKRATKRVNTGQFYIHGTTYVENEQLKTKYKYKEYIADVNTCYTFFKRKPS